MAESDKVRNREDSDNGDSQDGSVRSLLRRALRKKFEDSLKADNDGGKNRDSAGNQQPLAERQELALNRVAEIARNQHRHSDGADESRGLITIPFHTAESSQGYLLTAGTS